MIAGVMCYGSFESPAWLTGTGAKYVRKRTIEELAGPLRRFRGHRERCLGILRPLNGQVARHGKSSRSHKRKRCGARWSDWKIQDRKRKARRALFAAVVMGCVWIFYDDAELKPLYFFVGVSLALVDANSFGLANVYAQLHQMLEQKSSIEARN